MLRVTNMHDFQDRLSINRELLGVSRSAYKKSKKGKK